ncbi:MAG: DHH family phosphoesterase [Solobacterium sp.]|nr:DHH family phosphoesterase [Solobacterium sp.]
MSFQVLRGDPDQLMETYGLSSLCAKAISVSNLNEEQIRELMDSDESLHTSKCEAVDQVAKRIIQAKENHEKVFVAGDYDADGICSTAIMKDILDRLGIPNGYYIPDRFKEGYGLSSYTVKLAHDKGYSLIITVDNGVKCFEAIHTAKSLGMDIIVTDHHQIEEPVPSDLLLHPDVMEPEYEYLSGAGVVLELSRTLLGELRSHTSLAAIALIGDVMPLWKETRRIVRAGIRELSQGSLPAVSALFRKGTVIDETAISFQIVPKLNSIGRMNDSSNVNTLVPFLLCNDPIRIHSYAQQLEGVNQARRRCSDQMVKKALAMENEEAFPVIFDESFFEGVSGLAAGKLARTWHKPVLVLSRHDEHTLKGSARGVPGMNLYEFFRNFEELEEFGGHPGAVGLSIEEENLDLLCAHVKQAMEGSMALFQETYDPSFLCDEADLTLEQVMAFEAMRPFPKELVIHAAVWNPQVQSINRYERVTRYHFSGRNNGFDGVLFRTAHSEAEDAPEWIVGVPEINRFKDRVSVQITIDDFDCVM